MEGFFNPRVDSIVELISSQIAQITRMKYHVKVREDCMKYPADVCVERILGRRVWTVGVSSKGARVLLEAPEYRT
jgi:hypothetical protein